MPRRRIVLKNRKQRSVLTDMLPFEVPPTFSNRGFYKFLEAHEVEIVSRRLQWVSDSSSVDKIIKLIFSIDQSEEPSTTEKIEWGKKKTTKVVLLKKCDMDTIPYNFTVSHNIDGRVLSVVHPRNQVQVASFYAAHYASIIYYTSLSEFSIRKPVSVSRYTYHRDRLHELRLDSISYGIEEENKEYELLGSYFVYRRYKNIHQFFESYKYHRCEKKFDYMTQVDISRCFDSIYTHSLSWAILGKQQTKFDLPESKTTFGGKFDAVMQNLNHKETNGIVIGPEFSRIFAEIILQSVDVELEKKLLERGYKHKVDYEIFRYVDDYFIFFEHESVKFVVVEEIQRLLRLMKLSINPAKVIDYNRPIITDITIAKEDISSLLNSEINPEFIESDEEENTEQKLICKVNTNSLTIKFKTIIKLSGVKYGDLINYTFAIIENKIGKILKFYLKLENENRDEKQLIKVLLSIFEFAFFVYSASPRVNHTIRICRMITTAADFLNKNEILFDLKHILFKYIHDNTLLQLEKNKMMKHREVETLYLLIALSKIGKMYWLTENTLAKYFLIEEGENGNYIRDGYLSHFAITVLLSYIRDKKRYSRLREFIESDAVDKLKYSQAHCHNDSESLILFLDFITCPWIRDQTKVTAAALFGLSEPDFLEIVQENDYWFTTWGDKFDLGKELDAKRSREVY